MPSPALKCIPTDFVVREAIAVELVNEADATVEYLQLRKVGYTTFEAIRLLTEALNLSAAQVAYAGLKDEDGVTEQLVSVPAGVVRNGGDLPIAQRDGAWIVVRHHGYGRQPMSIGKLAGNAFRIVVRDMDPRDVDAIQQRRKILAFVLNYYDTQRFGVPGGPKRTHYLGSALLAQDWDSALSELAALRAPESKAASEWRESPEKFFRTADPRLTSFYLAAHASRMWNSRLCDLVSKLCPDSAYTVSFDGIDYLWTSSPADAARTLAQVFTLPYERYEFTDEGIITKSSTRSTVVQTTMEISNAGIDERHPGRGQLTSSFFLPSGSYATSAVRQVLGYKMEPSGS
jgi:tRNA pseudouridine13 synthase